jgi:SAM-dependent methyltransferase
LLGRLKAVGYRVVESLYCLEPHEYARLRSPYAVAEAADPVSMDSEAGAQRADVVVPAASRVPAARFAGRPTSTALFSVFGDSLLESCPVCRSADTVPLWRMPATTLARPIQLFGGYFNEVPTLKVPGTLYCFDFCNACESIFLNPVLRGQKQGYRGTDYYIRKMHDENEWRGYEDVYDSFAKWIPEDATVMLDAACGIGQYLHVARRRQARTWRKLIGLELAEKYVQHMREEGFEAHAFDLDADDLEAIVPSASVDFISFCEGFEHVEQPLEALRKLLTALRTGGRLYFTAQRYGMDVRAAVRPGEPIYIGDKVVSELPEWLGCRLLSRTTSATRYHVHLRRPLPDVVDRRRRRDPAHAQGHLPGHPRAGRHDPLAVPGLPRRRHGERGDRKERVPHLAVRRRHQADGVA